MAKKTPVKKSKRRLKRGVRRSLAAVLMITAIGVAAIPVPENYAAPDDYAIMPLVAASHSVDYSYPSNGADETSGDAIKDNYWMKPVNGDLDKSTYPETLTKPENTMSYQSMVIRETSGQKWEYNWQFEFFKGIPGGVISNYNSKFKQATVTLDYNVVYAYDVVEQETFNTYFTKHANDSYILGDPAKSGTVKPAEGNNNDRLTTARAFFMEYFPDRYQEQVDAYAEWVKNGEKEQDKPEDITIEVWRLTLDDRLKYYCEHNYGNYIKEDKSTGKIEIKQGDATNADLLRGYILEEVNDSRDPGVVDAVIYIPRLSEDASYADGAAHAKDVDSHRFKTLGTSSIVAIGDRAFQGVGNVDYLTIPDEIGYIGESAFEDSFIKSVAIVDVQRIGNRAFKNCTQLTDVTMGDGTRYVGTEAFYNTGISSIDFPYSITKIGPGAFAKCAKLLSVDFSKIGGGLNIYDYAFYDDVALSSSDSSKSFDFMQENGTTPVNVTTIGYAAFAVESDPGSLTSFEFPSTIDTVASYTKYEPKNDAMKSGLGDLVLAGRANLEYVVFPTSLGKNSEATLPDDLLYNCTKLQYVVFPDDGTGSCGLVTYNSKVFFSTITNEDFYVRGPELDRNRAKAAPRQATWKAETRVSDFVPYIYVRNDVEYYEVSDGTYLLCINNEGILTSCELVQGAKVSEWNGELVIPSVVGNIKVKGIASDCFSSSELNENVKSLIISDNSLTSIADGAFRAGGGDNGKDWKSLQKVYIGNSVTTVGANAFRDCISLVDVTFATPLVGYEAFTIGDDAFTTESPKLTFHGDIVEGYQPFDWATDPDNIIKTDTGLRVCYTSLSPTYLTVMYNPITEMVTLLDYPKYSEINSILNDEYADEIKRAGEEVNRKLTYETWRQEVLYAQYGRNTGDEIDNRRVTFAGLWNKAEDDAARRALYSNSYYGPWITKEFCENWDKWIDGVPASSDGRASDDRSDNKLTDWLFKPIIAYAAEEEAGSGGGSTATPKPQAYFDIHPYSVSDANTDQYSIYHTDEERSLLYYTKNIVIPEGVDSIDVFGYLNDLTTDGVKDETINATNSANVSAYLTGVGGWDFLSEKMYKDITEHDNADNLYVQPGLFSGYYQDEDDAPNDTTEKRIRGNDAILSVDMRSVKYLPNHAFDSCENLIWVKIGPDLADIGDAPFRGCYTLTNVEGNDYYTEENGILYSYNSDGSLTIEECLAARGQLVGQSVINSSTDPSLYSVSYIQPGAFEDCDHITEVDFGSNDTAGLKLIPQDCFKNCDDLQTVVLPMTTNEVQRGVFEGVDKLSRLTVWGKEVQISARAFDGNPEKSWTTVRAYEDSAVVRYVGQYGEEYKLRIDDTHWLEEWWLVSFYNQNYELIENLKDEEGNNLDNPQYVQNGDQAVRPQDPENTDDWTFERWVGTNNVGVNDRIYEDVSFYAQGYSESGMVNGKYPVTFWDGVDGSQVGPTQYIELGKDAVAPGHPVHAGYEQDGYSDTYTNIQSPKTIILKYKPIGTSGGSSGTPGSGSNSSTSNQNSSTSTSSTTSGSGTTAKYTVTVENGSGSGSYDVGSTVIIAANTPPAGMVFQKWTTESNGVALASVSMTATTFVMPANNVTVKANYIAGGSNTGTSGSVGGNTGGNSGGTTGNGSTRVDITKPGISNKDLATANVNGSTDNFVVKITETDEATRAVADALTNKYGSLENILYYAMDISLYDSTGTVKITNTSGLSIDITIPIPDALVAYGGNNMAGAVINGNQLENLNESFTTINGVPCIRFTATHFSPYTIYVDTGNLTEGMLDTTPKTGDPIHPKWFLSIGLACLSVILFMKKDKAVKAKTA